MKATLISRYINAHYKLVPSEECWDHSPPPKKNSYYCSLYIAFLYTVPGASQVAPVVKNPPASAGVIRDTGSIPGSGRSSGGRHGNPLQDSCLENPMDRGAWRATVHGVTKSGNDRNAYACMDTVPTVCQPLS